MKNGSKKMYHQKSESSQAEIEMCNMHEDIVQYLIRSQNVIRNADSSLEFVHNKEGAVWERLIVAQTSEQDMNMKLRLHTFHPVTY